MKNYNFSIIIPHKNTPKLLQRCIDSIPDRDDIQVIIVDDDSDSRIVDFNNFPGKDRVNTEIYLTKEGKGAGYARNIGLQHANGKWILFADADDFYSEHLRKILNDIVSKQYDYDIFYYMVDSCDSKTLEPANRNTLINRHISNYLMKSVDIRFKIFDVWNKVFRYDFLIENNIFFEEVVSGNDILFSTKADFYAKNIKVCGDIIYVITISSNSLSYTLSKEVIHSRIKERAKRNMFLHKKGMDDKKNDCFGLLKKAYDINLFFLINETLYYYNIVSYKQFIFDLFSYLKSKV